MDRSGRQVLLLAGEIQRRCGQEREENKGGSFVDSAGFVGGYIRVGVGPAGMVDASDLLPRHVIDGLAIPALCVGVGP